MPASNEISRHSMSADRAFWSTATISLEFQSVFASSSHKRKSLCLLASKTHKAYMLESCRSRKMQFRYINPYQFICFPKCSPVGNGEQHWRWHTKSVRKHQNAIHSKQNTTLQSNKLRSRTHSNQTAHISNALILNNQNEIFALLLSANVH